LSSITILYRFSCRISSKRENKPNVDSSISSGFINNTTKANNPSKDRKTILNLRMIFTKDELHTGCLKAFSPIKQAEIVCPMLTEK